MGERGERETFRRLNCHLPRGREGAQEGTEWREEVLGDGKRSTITQFPSGGESRVCKRGADWWDYFTVLGTSSSPSDYQTPV